MSHPRPPGSVKSKDHGRHHPGLTPRFPTLYFPSHSSVHVLPTPHEESLFRLDLKELEYSFVEPRHTPPHRTPSYLVVNHVSPETLSPVLTSSERLHDPLD